MIEVLVQGAFVSDKVAVVNSSGWERMIVQSESSKKRGALSNQREGGGLARGSQATAPSLGRRAVKPFSGGRRSGTTLSSAWLR